MVTSRTVIFCGKCNAEQILYTTTAKLERFVGSSVCLARQAGRPSSSREDTICRLCICHLRDGNQKIPPEVNPEGDVRA